jgi:hypothetical protein
MNRSIFIIFAALLIMGCQPIAAAQYSNYRAIVNHAVKDPNSTEFRNEKVSSNGTYCAEVNSKNSYGAFVGFERVMSGPVDTDGKSYVFFERDGLQSNNNTAGVIIGADIAIATMEARINAKKQELAGGDKATLGEGEYQQIALGGVFEEKWSENCSK